MPVLLGIGGVSLPITMASLSEKFQWVKPAFVCEVAFAEWTSDERLRQTTFLGWRDDNNPTEVVLEQTETITCQSPSRLQSAGNAAEEAPIDLKNPFSD
jgi:bifunctional non-homologous end joining protein LigD